MRRAVPVSEDDAGFADDPADGGVGVAFLGAFPFDEHGAALGGEGDAGRAFVGEGAKVACHLAAVPDRPAIPGAPRLPPSSPGRPPGSRRASPSPH